MKRYILLLLVIFSFLTNSYAQSTSVNPVYRLLSSNWIEAKNYYLLTLFEQNKAINQQLKNDVELSKITQKKIKDLNSSVSDCKDAACFVDHIKFTDEEISAVS